MFLPKRGSSAVHKVRSVLSLHNATSNRRNHAGAATNPLVCIIAALTVVICMVSRQPTERLSKWLRHELKAIAKVGSDRNDGPMACPSPRRCALQPRQWSVITLTEGSARLKVSKPLMSQVDSTPRTCTAKTAGYSGIGRYSLRTPGLAFIIQYCRPDSVVAAR
jgi:hypothetical protein